MNPTGSTDLVEIEMTEPIESKTAPQSVEIEIRDSLVEEVELNPIEEKKSARAAIVQKIRDQQQRFSGLTNPSTISAKREERKRKANSTAGKAKTALKDFWQGHRNMRNQGQPQGHHSSNAEEKKRHEAAYSLFLKHKFTPDVAFTGDDKPHVSKDAIFFNENY